MKQYVWFRRLLASYLRIFSVLMDRKDKQSCVCPEITILIFFKNHTTGGGGYWVKILKKSEKLNCVFLHIPRVLTQKNNP